MDKNYLSLHNLILSLPTEKPKLPDKYSGSVKKHLYVRIPVLTKHIKTWNKKHELNLEEFQNLIITLSKSNIHEEIIAIGKLLEANSALRKQLNCKVLFEITKNLHGWEEIDAVCQGKFTGKEFLNNRKCWENLLKKLNQSNNISQQRASLVLPIKFIRDIKNDSELTDLSFENIKNLIKIDDILITKAISWILREMAKSSDFYKTRVKQFIGQYKTKLKKHIVTEVIKKL